MDKYAIERPIQIAKILYEQTDEDHSLTTAQLMRELKEIGIPAHRQTIKVDIQHLQNCGLEIREIKSSQNKYSIINRPFNSDELKLLNSAVASFKFITKATSKDLEAKLGSLAGEYLCPELNQNIICENRVKRKNEAICLTLDTVNRAINENRQISFHYFHYDENKRHVRENNGNPYIITPLHLVWNDDFYYIIGLNEDRSIRTFRVDRMADCPDILDEKGKKPREKVRINQCLNTAFHVFGRECRSVELICDNDVMDAVIDQFGFGVKKAKIDDATFKITGNVSVGNVFYSWVFGLGGKVRISSPEDIKNAYADMVRHAAGELGKD